MLGCEKGHNAKILYGDDLFISPGRKDGVL